MGGKTTSYRDCGYDLRLAPGNLRGAMLGQSLPRIPRAVAGDWISRARKPWAAPMLRCLQCSRRFLWIPVWKEGTDGGMKAEQLPLSVGF